MGLQANPSKPHEGIKVKRFVCHQHKQLVAVASAKICNRPATQTNAMQPNKMNGATYHCHNFQMIMVDCSGLPLLPPLHPTNPSSLSPTTFSTNSLWSKRGKCLDDSVAVPAKDDAVMDDVTLLPALKKIWECEMIEWGKKCQRGLHLALQAL